MRQLAFGLVLLTWLVGGSVARGQDYTGRPIREVRIQGLVRVSEQAVRAKLEVQAGQVFNSGAVARDIRRLYELGYFSTLSADAQLEAGEVVLTYLVEEKRFIQEIKLVGCKKVKPRHVRAVLSWREGDTFVPEAYEDEREAILRLYRSKGFANATVDILVEEIGPSRVRITYKINEARKARIRKLTFVGNETISDRKLRKLMKTRRAWWFLGGKFDEETLEMDLENILDEYGNYGRLEAEIVRTDLDYSKDGKGVALTIEIGEGPEYTVAAMETAGNAVFDDDEIERLLKVRAGDVHNKGQVEEDAQLVLRGYQDSGYIGAQVTPQVTLDRDQKTTHVVHRVEEGDLKYVREIKITGNTVTRDDVIRREVLTIPGERFDGALLRASQARLENLEYFDAVRMTVEQIEDSDEFANLLLDVEEGKTGYFNFGGGYSTEEQFGAFAELRFDNFDIANWPRFSGGGQHLRLRLQVGTRRSEYFLGFTDPEIFGYPLAFGFDVFNESFEHRDGTRYTEERTGAQVRFAKVLSPYVTARSMLRYTDTSIGDLPFWIWTAFPREYRQQRDGTTTVSTIWGVTRNTQDSRRDPTSGSRHDIEVELAGLGGDNYFYRIAHDSTWYWSLDEPKKWILSYRTREGWVNDYGRSDFVPLQERFYAGGSGTVRGYDSRDIGPQQRGWPFHRGYKQRVGGEFRIVENLELKYKLTKQLRLYTFLDAGGVWEELSEFDAGDIKFGAGLGFGVDVPRLGPIRLDYGIPLNPDDDQGHGRLHIFTGFRF